jgi:hypothetical protein
LNRIRAHGCFSGSIFGCGEGKRGDRRPSQVSAEI